MFVAVGPGQRCTASLTMSEPNASALKHMHANSIIPIQEHQAKLEPWNEHSHQNSVRASKHKVFCFLCIELQ